MTTAAHCLYLGVALPLAAGALVDAWRNGSIFAGSRAAVEATLESDATGLRGFLAAMLNCPFCLGYHVPWLLLLTGYGPARLLEATD